MRKDSNLQRLPCGYPIYSRVHSAVLLYSSKNWSLTVDSNHYCLVSKTSASADVGLLRDGTRGWIRTSTMQGLSLPSLPLEYSREVAEGTGVEPVSHFSDPRFSRPLDVPTVSNLPNGGGKVAIPLVLTQRRFRMHLPGEHQAYFPVCAAPLGVSHSLTQAE